NFPTAEARRRTVRLNDVLGGSAAIDGMVNCGLERHACTELRAVRFAAMKLLVRRGSSPIEGVGEFLSFSVKEALKRWCPQRQRIAFDLDIARLIRSRSGRVPRHIQVMGHLVAVELVSTRVGDHRGKELRLLFVKFVVCWRNRWTTLAGDNNAHVPGRGIDEIPGRVRAEGKRCLVLFSAVARV